MTFGPVFPAVFSKSFTTQLGGGAWWNLFGAISNANVIGAYLAKGAASQAVSYSNLVTPGTYDLTTASAPTWDATNGWKFSSASSQYLLTGITPASTWTLAFRYSNLATVTRNIFGQLAANANQYFRNESTSSIDTYWGSGSRVNTRNTSGVWSLAQKNVYYNGALQGATTGTYTGTPTPIYIGATAASFGTLYIQAAVIYNITLDATQNATLATLMAAL